MPLTTLTSSALVTLGYMNELMIVFGVTENYSMLPTMGIFLISMIVTILVHCGCSEIDVNMRIPYFVPPASPHGVKSVKPISLHPKSACS